LLPPQSAVINSFFGFKYIFEASLFRVGLIQDYGDSDDNHPLDVI